MSNQISFDHIVHAVRNPEDARQSFSNYFSWPTALGGKHPQWGTYNALSYFGLSYLEWIGVEDETQAKETEFGSQVVHRLASGEGAVQYALRTSDMDAVVATWRKANVPFSGPFEASRTRPDGKTLRWRMLFPQQAGIDDFKLPFFIEWGEADADRLTDLQQSGLIDTRRNGSVRAVHTVVRDLNALATRWQTYFSLSLHAVQMAPYGDGLVVELDGDCRLYFWTGVANEQSILASAGEVPFQVDLAGLPTDTVSKPNVALHGLYVNLV